MKRRGFLGVLTSLGIIAAAPAVPFAAPSPKGRDYSELGMIIETEAGGDQPHVTKSLYRSHRRVITQGIAKRYQQITGRITTASSWD